jgi:hypothetical protein
MSVVRCPSSVEVLFLFDQGSFRQRGIGFLPNTGFARIYSDGAGNLNNYNGAL